MVEEVKRSTRMMDVVSMEIRKPVVTRMRNRLKELRELSCATTETVKYGDKVEHYTSPPKKRIYNVSGIMEGANKSVITYYEYAVDKETGNIKTNVSYVEKDGKKYENNAEPIIEAMVIETIEYLTPLRIDRKTYT